jgi:hypothetical protein
MVLPVSLALFRVFNSACSSLVLSDSSLYLWFYPVFQLLSVCMFDSDCWFCMVLSLCVVWLGSVCICMVSVPDHDGVRRK